MRLRVILSCTMSTALAMVPKTLEIQKANSELLRTTPKTKEPASAPAAPAAKPTQTSAPGVPPKKGTPAYGQLPEGGLYEDTDGTIRRKKKE